MEKEQYRGLFLFAAKTGSLEGYLFERREVEPLEDWVGNIVRMYQELPTTTRKEVAPVLTPVLEKILEYGESVLESGLREKLEQMLVTVSGGGETNKAE